MLCTTRDLAIRTFKSPLISNLEVLLEVVGEPLGWMVEKTVVAGSWSVVFVASHLVEKLEWRLVEAVGTDLELLDSVVGAHCLE